MLCVFIWKYNEKPIKLRKIESNEVFFSFLLFSKSISNRDERRDLNYGWHNSDDFYGFSEPKPNYPKTASRREGIEDSDENDESKESSESPSGLY